VNLRHSNGFSLTELMIAVVLGLTLLAAFLVVLERCRTGFAANESVARLQDSARHALSVLVPDIELAGFYGFTNRPVARLASPLPAGAHACGTGFAVALRVPVEGSDNSFRLGGDARDCEPTASAGGASATADTLTVRHAAAFTSAARAGRLQIYSHALAAAGPLLLFADGRAPGPVDSDHAVRDLEIRSYYIANNSVERPAWPALRVKALTESRGAAQFRDEEILPGIEDLQLEFGVMSAGADGAPRVRYVAPGSAPAHEGSVVAVRLWLRIRADTTEAGFLDTRELNYANVRFAPSPLEARQRRLLIERTVALRNSQSP
jgi:type IV pilus assembly protein PilW